MIIAYTCLIDAFNFYNYFSRYVACGYDLNVDYDRLFASTVQDPYYYVKCKWLEMGCTWDQKIQQKKSPFESGNGYYPDTVSLRLRWWYLTTDMMLFWSLLLNLFTILDLYIMLTKPFQNPHGRSNRIILTTFAIAFSISVVSLIQTSSENPTISEKSSIVFNIMTGFNIISSFVVLLLVQMRLSKGGTSIEVKKQISTRYTEFVLIFVLLSYPIITLMKP